MLVAGNVTWGTKRLKSAKRLRSRQDRAYQISDSRTEVIKAREGEREEEKTEIGERYVVESRVQKNVRQFVASPIRCTFDCF